VFSTKDFKEMCWHDNAIHGFYILEGDVYNELVFKNGGSLTEWTMELNWPPDSFFKFQANGFIQTQRMEPITTTAQCLSPSERISLP
jgi:hypothetical protein